MPAPAVLVAVSMGVTVLVPLLATYSVDPSGAITIALGKRPTRIGVPVRCVAVLIGVTVLPPEFST